MNMLNKHGPRPAIQVCLENRFQWWIPGHENEDLDTVNKLIKNNISTELPKHKNKGLLFFFQKKQKKVWCLKILDNFYS